MLLLLSPQLSSLLFVRLFSVFSIIKERIILFIINFDFLFNSLFNKNTMFCILFYFFC